MNFLWGYSRLYPMNARLLDYPKTRSKEYNSMLAVLQSVYQVLSVFCYFAYLLEYLSHFQENIFQGMEYQICEDRATFAALSLFQIFSCQPEYLLSLEEALQ